MTDPLVDGTGRPISVFTRESEVQLEASSTSDQQATDVDYEFTERDLHAVMSGYAAKNNAKHLRTRHLREQAETAKKEEWANKTVPIRIELPDGYIIQGLFPATAQLKLVHDVVKQVLHEAHTGSFHLFTAPPKIILKDLEVTLYDAKMIPAARLHVGVDAKNLSQQPVLLNETALAMCAAPPPKAAALAVNKAANGGKNITTTDEGVKPPVVPRDPSAGAKKSGGVPKWLKLGK